MTGRTSWRGLKKICTYEAFVAVPYRDGGTDDAPQFSQGFGSQFPIPIPGSTITIEEGFIRARRHVDTNDLIIGRLIHEPLQQHEWDAVASLFYQSGMAPLRAVATWLAEDLTIREIATKWLEYDYEVDKKTLEKIHRLGLAKRRQSERLLAIFGDYGDISTFKFYDGDPHKFTPTLKDFPAEEPQIK